MKREIKIRNLNSKKYLRITYTAAALFVLAFLCWFLDGPIVYAYIAAGVAITLFAYLSMDSFTTSNAVSYGSKSVTMKLLGHKTIGFLFTDLREVRLQELGLLIRVDGMEDLKLSRKRYTDQSLEELHTILQEKTTLQ
ncbi:hypothetical protein SAMN05192588_1493 [Nonlabens sp. Hel1_33_55]|uniref:hypothetical protein n=1 Tax=Nonlabens sp. Hel1_33_55 TaxID=1336802 RepID=UPI000875AC0C|nr:hypothetical protein [Nonlabens sp. Hel1_33_55]SCY17210.1 hypothetical protein SAMN05192588_1493 [Nonlabens sp. Hel1_33_55]